MFNVNELPMLDNEQVNELNNQFESMVSQLCSGILSTKTPEALIIFGGLGEEQLKYIDQIVDSAFIKNNKENSLNTNPRIPCFLFTSEVLPSTKKKELNRLDAYLLSTNNINDLSYFKTSLETEIHDIINISDDQESKAFWDSTLLLYIDSHKSNDAFSSAARHCFSYVGDCGVVWLQLPEQAIQSTNKTSVSDIGNSKPDISIVLEAAINRLFPTEQYWQVIRNANNSESSANLAPGFLTYFEKRSYSVRHPIDSDLDELVTLELQCWPEDLAMSRDTLVLRVQEFPQGHLVVEEKGRVTAVIYSQRIDNIELIEQETSVSVDHLHNPEGTIGQLLAVNVAPDMQHRRLGDQLLEILLQGIESQAGIKTVVGVTRCKAFSKYRDSSNNSKINTGDQSERYQKFVSARDKNGWLLDPVLRFHELHGASIVKPLPGYRELDDINSGHGVLVRYDILTRERINQSLAAKTKISGSNLIPDTGLGSENSIGVTIGSTISATTSNSDFSEEEVNSFVITSIASFLPQEATDLDLTAPLMEMGLDSGDLLSLGLDLTEQYQLDFPATFFFEYNTTRKVVEYICEQLDAQAKSRVQNSSEVAPSNKEKEHQSKSANRNDIAIVGAVCRLPSGINSPDDLWQFLKEGKSAISDLPDGRWEWPEGIDIQSQHMGINRGGFIDCIDEFDAGFFRISPREAELMDPQQRIMLQLSWECFEDAGYMPSAFEGSKTGVFIGASGSDYQLLLNERLPSVDAYTGLATSMAILPNRISYFYDFIGSSVQVDTACSSSLVAIQKAVEELRQGECEQALVGGIHMMCHPMNSIAYYKAGMLAPDAQCKTFDDSANGYVRSEGAVMMLLKPLEKALTDNDHIYGVLKGGAINHGGRAGGLTVPHPGRQAELIRDAHKDAGLSPQHIGYVEAHGTGTSLGDPIEVEGLKSVFSGSDTPCALGSLKANLGHLEAAAGISSLLKVLMSFKRKHIPAQINFKHLNNKIDLSSSPFYVLDKPLNLQSDTSTLLVGISSFGSGGANAHVVVESFPETSYTNTNTAQKTSYLNNNTVTAIVLSAKNSDSLRRYAIALLDFLTQNRNNNTVNLDELAYTSQVAREPMSSRLCCVIDSVEQLIDTLKKVINTQEIEGLYVLEHQKNAFEQDSTLSSAVNAWVSGEKVLWDKLWRNTPQKCTFPFYPFSRDKYWLDTRNSEGFDDDQSTRALEENKPKGWLHPLVGINTSTLKEQRFSSDFTGNEFFLKDHCVSGRPVLPAVAYLEMVRAAVSHSILELLEVGVSVEKLVNLASQLRFSDVIYEKAFFVEQAETLSVSFSPIQSSNTDTIALVFDIYSQTEERIRHATGRVTYSEHNQHKEEVDLNFLNKDLPKFKNSLSTEAGNVFKQSKDFYSYLDDLALNYGPSHQTIKSIVSIKNMDQSGVGSNTQDQQAEDIVLAEFSLPEHLLDTANEFLWHPSILDAALQSIYILDRSAHNTTPTSLSLPYSIGKFAQYSPIPASGYIQVALNRGKTRVADRSTIKIINEAGVVCALFEDVARREIKLNHSTALLLKEEWRGASLEKKAVNSDSNVSIDMGVDVRVIFLCNPTDETIETISNSSIFASNAIDTRCIVLASDTTNSLAEQYLDLSRQLIVYLQGLLLDKQYKTVKCQLVLPIGGFEADTNNKSNIELAHSGEQYRGLGQIFKSAQLENPKVSAQVIGLDTPNTSALITALEDNYFSDNFDIRYINGHRETLAYAELEGSSNQTLATAISTAKTNTAIAKNKTTAKQSNSSLNHLVKEGGVYVISGGLGSIGQLFAEHIFSAATHCTVFLLGRSLGGEERQSDFSRLQKIASESQGLCEFHAVDVSSYEAVQDFIDTVNTSHGAINGVIHSAGLLRDRFIVQKSENETIEVFQAKARALEVLDRCTAEQPLGFFIGFSSTSGVFGNIGQADYAAANAFVDLYLQNRAEDPNRNGKSFSLSWPLWKEGGMQIDSSSQSQMRNNFGIQPIASIDAMEAFSRAYEQDESHITLVHGELAELREKLSINKLNTSNAVDTLNSANSESNPLNNTYPVNVDRSDSSLKNKNASEGQNVSDQNLHKIALELLIKTFSKVSKLPASKFKASEAFENYGIDSILITQLTSSLEETFGTLSKTLFFEYQTAAELADYFVESHSGTLLNLAELNSENSYQVNAPINSVENTDSSVANASLNNNSTQNSASAINGGEIASRLGVTSKFNTLVQPKEKSSGFVESKAFTDEIAIVGLAGRYPQANNVEEFWANLQQGRDCITEVPAARWDMSQYFDSEKGKQGKSHSKWGGFIDGIDEFDPLFFNISPHEAENIDPQERLFLQCVYHTLEDAGYTRESLAHQYPFKVGKSSSGANVGVFVGVMYSEYQLYAAQANNYGLLGNISSIANRASYFCDFHGPSFAVDTMCSSSLTAIHLACESIRRGECNAAVAGGVNLTVHPNKYLALSQGMFVSSNGRCMSFGEGGDGYVPSEGVGALLLKPLSQAERDGDHIYGLIKGSAINHGGKNNGYTVPNPNVQAEVISSAIKNAGINPRTISFVEAHGTGTALGDPIEITGLTKAFSAFTDEKQFCAIGSAKSNIGHCESAAGIAGLTKILLQMKHHSLVPSLHSDPLNSKIQFESTPFVVQKNLSSWEKPKLTIDGETKEFPRIASLSSFGAGGANSHLLVEEYSPATTEVTPVSLPVVILLSAKTETQLKIAAKSLLAFIESYEINQEADNKTAIDLLSMAYTLQVGREAMPVRLGFECKSVDDCKGALISYIADDSLNDSLDESSEIELITGNLNENETLADIIDTVDEDTDFTATVRSWMQKQKLDKLLSFWCKGLTINWQELYDFGAYGKQKPKRISLPGYPFAKQRCWVPLPELNTVSSSALNSIEYLHPLLHNNQSNITGLRFSSTFDGSETFLSDHVVNQESILPAAAFIEMALASAIHGVALDRDTLWSCCLENLSFEAPAILQNGALSLSTRIWPETETTLAFTIENTDQTTVYARGSLVFGTNLTLDSGFSVEEVKAHSHQILDKNSLYQNFSNIGLNYGPHHQGLEQVAFGHNEKGDFFALGSLFLNDSLLHDSSAYNLHPSLLDSIFQTCLSAFDTTLSLPVVPFSIGRLEFYGAVDANSTVVVNSRTLRQSSTKSFDLMVLNQKGEVSLQLHDFVIRQLNTSLTLQATNNSLENNLVGELTLSPVWEQFTPVKSEAWPATTENILILGSEDASVSALTSGLITQIQNTFSHVSFIACDNSQSISDYQQALTSISETKASIDHIFWLLPNIDSDHIDNTAANTSDLDISNIQKDGIFSAFNIVKALLNEGYDAKKLGITIVTQTSVSISQQEQNCPIHAAIYGFIGSLLEEYPQWDARIVDVENDISLKQLLHYSPKAQVTSDTFTSSNKTNTAVKDISSNTKVREVAYRDGLWHRRVITPAVLTESNSSSANNAVYKQGGCYVLIGGAGGLGEVYSEYLAKQHQAQVIWVGRRQITDDIIKKCKHIASVGPEPVYIAADANSEQAMADLANEVKSRFGTINGVIHTAIVLNDKGIASIDESGFRASFDVKLNASVNMVKAFDSEDLDFILFFSSLQSLYRPAGQSNYAAGCAFIDAYACYLDSVKAFPVKTINWGYWGSVGVVASDDYRQRMEEVGLGSIEPAEGLPFIEKVLSSNISQALFIKTTKKAIAATLQVDRSKQIVCLDTDKTTITTNDTLTSTTEFIEREFPINRSEVEFEVNQFDSLLAKKLYCELDQLKLFSNSQFEFSGDNLPAGISSGFYQWLKESMAILSRHGYLNTSEGDENIIHINLIKGEKLDHNTINQQWIEYKNNVNASSPSDAKYTLKAQVSLVDATLENLSVIVTGEVPSTQVIFPDASVKLVEGVYKNNLLADFYNDVLADKLIEDIDKILSVNKEHKVRILEIGAGTGGTSARLFERLKNHRDSIGEYTYTDISKAFLIHAEDNFREQAPYLTTKIFDVSQSIYPEALYSTTNASSGNEHAVTDNTVIPGSYDFVVATNVLHATPNIIETLRHSKVLLRSGGSLLINELSQNSPFLHLTFGLLDGWWLSSDVETRIPGSPLLTPQRWQSILENLGFNNVELPARSKHTLGQSIISATSNGVALFDQNLNVIKHLDHNKQQATAKVDLAVKQPIQTQLLQTHPAPIPSTNKTSTQSDNIGLKQANATNHLDSLEERFEDYLKSVVADALKMSESQLDSTTSFEDYGVDSIIVVRLTNALRESIGEVSSTLLFEVSNLRELAEHFLNNQADRVVELVGDSLIESQTNDVEENKPPESNSTSVNAVLPANLDSHNAVRFTVPANQLSMQQSESVSNTQVTFTDLQASTQLIKAQQTKTQQDVAIVGLSGRFPQADTLEQFWKNLCEGKNCIQEIPELRWDWSQYYSPNKGEVDSIYTKWGGFLNDIDAFDPLFFNISPREATAMDPQERLFLQCAYEAVEDAGFLGEDLSTEKNVGVFVGVMNNTYQQQPTHWSIANRVSYFFDFNGPSLAVDTACSSSLTAIILAAEKIRNGQCDACIAGGVNLIIDPQHYRGLSNMTMLSEGNQCASFGVNADGFVDGEGVGAVLLMPLSKALNEGAHIYGVIKGGAINHGGKTNGYTVPNPKQQAKVISNALHDAGVDAKDIGYIEAHGTGTVLGDPIEIAGLSKAFSEFTSNKQYCAIGSVKSNIGHGESAAGISALAKVILQIKHRKIVPSLHSQELNPNIDFSQTPFKVQQVLSDWSISNSSDGDTPSQRIAGISSFGAGGANAHLIVQEFVNDQESSHSLADKPLNSHSDNDEKSSSVLVFSAKTYQQLLQLLANVSAYIESADVNLVDLAYTLQLGRKPLDVRTGFTVSSITEASHKLTELVRNLQKSIEASDNLSTEMLIAEGVYDARAHKHSLDVFSKDDFSEILTEWFAKNKQEKILNAWLKGFDIDWSVMYSEQGNNENNSPRRISLPTYPFEKNRYWAVQNQSLVKEPVKIDLGVQSSNHLISKLHPLVHQNTSTLSLQKFSSQFTGNEFFLNDHQILGKKVIPSAAMLEMGRTAASLAYYGEVRDGASLSLKDVIFVQPLADEGQGINVDIHVSPVSEDSVLFEVCSLTGSEERVHAKGVVNFDSNLEANQRSKSIDLSAVEEHCQTPINTDTLYSTFSSFGIDFGHCHRTVTDIHHSSFADQNNFVLARVVCPDAAWDSDNPYIVHPAVMDGAFQAAVGIIFAREYYNNIKNTSHTGASIRPQPFRLRSLDCYAPLPKESIVVIQENPSIHSDKEMDVDVFVCDEAGVVYAEAKGFCSRLSTLDNPGSKVRPNTKTDLKTASSQAAISQTTFSQTTTQTDLAPAHAVTAPTIVDTSVIDSAKDNLVGDITLTGQWHRFVPNFMPNKMNSSATLILGADDKQLDQLSEHFANSVQLDKLADFGKKPLSQEDIAGALEEASRFDHILVVTPEPSIDALDIAATKTINEQSVGVFALYRLIKALLSLKYDHAELNITVITQRARAASKIDASNPAHSSIHGFVGSVAKEYKQWHIRLVDLPTSGTETLSEPWPLRDVFSLPENTSGLPLLYRQGVWYQQILSPVTFTKNTAESSRNMIKPAFKKGGLYLILGGAGGAGFEFSRYLVTHYKAQVIWLGRREENSHIKSLCDELEKLGPRPFYISADATNEAQLITARETVDETFGVVNGIVHSALVMSGASMSDMTEDRFAKGLGAKLHASVNVDAVFSHDNLDFSLFFSSIQAFDIEPKQSNYSAGTSFTDGYAEYLGNNKDYPVKVINWGYIAGTEFVSMKSFQQWMEHEGFGAVDIYESMPLIEKVIQSPINQCLIHKVTKAEALDSLPINKQQVKSLVHDAAVIDTKALPQATSLLLPSCTASYAEDVSYFDDKLLPVLLILLEEKGLFTNENTIRVSEQGISNWLDEHGIPTYLLPWVLASVHRLESAGYIHIVDGYWELVDVKTLDRPAVFERWAECRDKLIAQPAFRAQVKLIDSILPTIPDVLNGSKAATQVLFPSSSLDLVEGIYKNNQVSDFFNEVVAETLVIAIEEILRDNPDKQIKILEIGAGTGGTSQLMFEHLTAYKHNIKTYHYTDMSTTFLKHAKENFGDIAPYLTTGLLNIEQEVTDSSLIGEFDFVIASNVLHATANIGSTLTHAKSLLKSGGLLLLNELVENSLFLHLSFGLLEGWWLSEDTELRIPGSPLLSKDSWLNVLNTAGFETLHTPAEQGVGLRHQIFVAQSNGVISTSTSIFNETDTLHSSVASEITESSPLVTSSSVEPISEAIVSSQQQAVHNTALNSVDIEAVVISHLKENLMLSDSEIDRRMPFSDYGVDSVTGIRLVEQINTSLDINLSPTSIFDFSSVEKLVVHIKSNEVFESSTNSSTDSNTNAHTSSQAHSQTVDVISKPVSVPLTAQAQVKPIADVEAVVIRHLGEGLMLSESDIDRQMPFSDYGVDSVSGIRLVEQINASLNIDLSPTSIFDYSSVAKLVEHINSSFTVVDTFTVADTSEIVATPVATPELTTPVLSVPRSTATPTTASPLINSNPVSDTKTSSNDTETNVSHIKATVLTIISEALELNQDTIRSDEPFSDYGVDSVTGIRIVETINNQLSLDLSPTSLFDHSSVTKLVAHIMSLIPVTKPVTTKQMTTSKASTTTAMTKTTPTNITNDANTRSADSSRGKRQIHRAAKSYASDFSTELRMPVTKEKSTLELDLNPVIETESNISNIPTSSTAKDEPIAIIGISGRFATADTVEDFWRYLEAGTDLTQKVDRWDLSNCEGSDRPDFCDRGGFLNNIEDFDALFFNISGVEAAYIDPQQRFFLEEAWKTLEDGGYAGEAMSEKRCGVYAGYNGSDYNDLFIGDPSPAQALWGNAASLVSARIAYYLDLKGPAVTVDTACSSSLSAIHMACESIRSGENELALAGGVFIQSTAKFYEMANRASMLSPDGKCHTFDNKANGFVPGEGVGVLLLKKLSDAQKNGDHIYGVIRASGTNQDGTTNGITAPSAVSQQQLIEDIYKKYDISPSSIQMIEAHGTGTKLGDPIEFEALKRAFKYLAQERNESLVDNHCALGAVKTNIGHATAASGVAGVMKILMSLKHKTIAPSLNFDKPNAHIQLEQSPFYVPTKVSTWSEPESGIRRAAISSFGLSGTNVHTVIDSAPILDSTSVNNSDSRNNSNNDGKRLQSTAPAYLIVLSAISESRLKEQVQKLKAFCVDNKPTCANVSYSLATGRKHFSHRFACVVASTDEFIRAIDAWLNGQVSKAVYSSGAASIDTTNVDSHQVISETLMEQMVAECPSLITTSRDAEDNTYIKNLNTIALGFCQGITPKFMPLFEDEYDYKRIPLPVTLLKGKRHWVPVKTTTQSGSESINMTSSFSNTANIVNTNAKDINEFDDLLDQLINDDISIDDALDVIK